MAEKNQIYIYMAQVVFVCCVSYAFQNLQLRNLNEFGVIVARYVIYFIIIKVSHEGCLMAYHIRKKKVIPSMWKVFETCKNYVIIMCLMIALIVYFNERILTEHFLLQFIGYLIAKYPEVFQEKPSTMINYGTGMACSYFEGYLYHVLPTDGADVIGLQENMTVFEARHGIFFPVKKLFIVITKSLYCPSDLKEFNKPNRYDLPYIEARQSLEDVQKSVAGVIKRTYRTTVYKICRPAGPPVSLVTECATPLHTLHRTLERRLLCEQLDNLDKDEVVNDFCTTLQTILDQSPDCRGKCELVYFDDTDPNENLADVLLNKIRELEPNFEKLKSQ